LEGDPALLEMEKRVVPVEPAQELPHLRRGPADETERMRHHCDRSLLCTIRKHLPRTPFAVPDEAPIRQPEHFNSRAI
jgi:hypothetical protein